MENTWIRFLLPDDEYKRRNIMSYFAEAAILQLGVLVIMLILSRTGLISMDSELVLLLLLFGSAAYIGIRYILSGMEYTDIMTEKAFRKERKRIAVKSITFFLFFVGIYSLFYLFGAVSTSPVAILGVSILGAVILFITDYASLRRSYQKNKELID
ncbi:hypothetical protein SAMN05421503_0124 [Terribacillus aidingensis]|uniref:DUF3278 domain-containing protein n=1 Tax=Terribacillus aidingensis TaxID=586416 RepID=A0A285MZ74_9BACI|nr:hypothetical protein [Terribacillus aidingensis]SNZ02499.1 hypothetical protein SAMN05421503_0124 [Terribacillus aidingensis]